MNLSDLGKMKEMMVQAREMQAQMEEKLASTIVEAETGGGMVKVRMNGKKEVLRLTIEPTALGATTGDIELLEDTSSQPRGQRGRPPLRRGHEVLRLRPAQRSAGRPQPARDGVATHGPFRRAHVPPHR